MSTTTRSHGDSSGEPTAPLPLATPEGESLLASAAGDRCSVCGSELAADQRYCVECGTRRGKPRFSVTGTPAPREPVVTAPRRVVRSGSFSAGATLIAGVATLLLALGVGVLIGQSNSASGKAPKVQIVDVGSGSSGAAASTTGLGSTASTARGGSSSAKGSKHTKTHINPKALKKAPSKAVAQAAGQAAASTLKAAPGVKIAPPTTKQGGACSAGTAGCQNGKFTGAFFGQ